ncbi:MAG: ATP-binding protein [Oligoflexia bacterium]|nr:ATP-binding protein [Oligoflexia bacterium]
MKRIIYNDLLKWKNSVQRKPLILKGARQVGKSYILKEFGKKNFKKVHVIDFEKDNDKFSPIFDGDLDYKRLLLQLSLTLKSDIDKKNDLIIFDEIQNCPRAITSLKYFCEDLPELAICCAGSLLGIKLSKESFPVGKVNFLEMFPLSFEEYIQAVDHPKLFESYQEVINKYDNSNVIQNVLWEYLLDYYIVGGMPEIVYHFLKETIEAETENKSKTKPNSKYQALKMARERQLDLIISYKNDFKKHSGIENAIHIETVFENIPMQLSQYHNTSVKRYKFNHVIYGKKSFADLSGPIDWLSKAGLVIKVPVASQISHPLKSYCKDNLFKLYIFDIGILGAMLGLSPEVILKQNYGSAKGYFAENFVACLLNSSYQMHTHKNGLYSWNNKNHEIEFVIDFDGELIPIEVKSAHASRAKSLEIIINEFSLRKAIILSKDVIKIDHQKSNSKTKFSVDHYPLYATQAISRST